MIRKHDSARPLNVGPFGCGKGTLMIDAKVFRARTVLLAYLVFSLLVLGFYLWSQSQKDIREFLVPMTGWTGLDSYMWTLFFAVFALVHTNRIAFAPVLGMLGIVTAINAFQTSIDAFRAWSGQPDFGNPYLTYHPLRPVIIVVIPGAWLFALWLVSRGLPKGPGLNRSIGAS